ncbi:MAG: hypothetical protein JXB29_06495, partial [Sedimentisphaerales bacterium]|nr:hypothetical protein [Sedimentisphaerales bacterium]
MTGENELIYREEQRFGLWLRWLVVLSMASAVPFSIFSLTKISSEQGSPEILPIILLTITGIFVPTAVALLFGMLKLQTEVRPDGLYILTYVSPVPSDMILILELEQSSTSRGLS